MVRPPDRSLHWLTLAVVLPLVVLAVLAWLGTRTQLDAAWKEAREEATRRAEELASKMNSTLAAAEITVPLYLDPPVPGRPSERDTILDGNDIPVLLAMQKDPEAGSSPAGLPRRVLAALRIHELDPDIQDTEQVINLVTKVAPSILTRKALEVVGASEEQRQAWATAEDICRFAQRDPEAASGTYFTSRDGLTIWIESDDEAVRYIPFPKVVSVDDRGPIWQTVPSITEPEKSGPMPETVQTPDWMDLEMPKLTEIMLGSESPPPFPHLVATVPISVAGGLDVRAYIDATLLERNLRHQQGWTLALLAAAVLMAFVSLFSIHRVTTRERRLAELKSQFVSSVSHELRAPLGSIRLMAEALEQDKVRQPAEFHTMIAREGHRLSHLIENVLDFSRIEDGRKHYQFEECDLAALVGDTLDLMGPLARERRVAINPDLSEVIATIDPAAIQQSLVNLLDNAIKFSPESGTVTVSLRAFDGHWQLAVGDRGPGVPAAEQERIFERFHRLGNELRREHRGTGIGLSIVKHVAEAHDGSVTVASTSDGSTFTLSIPLAPCAS